jgi:DMSO/TMAO reductase YedYZ molybdopterin-dependent catalytic subunit
MKIPELSRRSLLGVGTAAFGGLLTSGCDRLSEAPSFLEILDAAEGLNYRVQRLLLSGHRLAREFPPSGMSPTFRTNGSTDPADPHYQRFVKTGFADWRLKVDGLVMHPMSFSLAELRALPAREQITRHDCVEGWSAIGRWKGVPLSEVLMRAALAPNARYIVFYCADDMELSVNGPILYYESIDLIDALHPQTILAYAMNGAPLSMGHGAPLRLRVERQLGYKHAKFVMHIQAVADLKGIGEGRGGYWEDRGYEWYAGI